MGGEKNETVSEEAAGEVMVEGEKLNWLSRALVKNENQSAGLLFTPIWAEIARNIDISIYKCTVLFPSRAALWPNTLIGFPPSFFFFVRKNQAGSV